MSCATEYIAKEEVYQDYHQSNKHTHTHIYAFKKNNNKHHSTENNKITNKKAIFILLYGSYIR